MLSVDNAPRDVNALMQLKRGVIYRLALQLSMFKREEEEKGFLGETTENQVQALSAALAAYDAERGGNGQVPSMGQPSIPPNGAPQQMQMPLQQPQMGQPPQAFPQMPQVQPPPQQNFQQQPPQMQMPQGHPQMPQVPQMAQQAPPQIPPQNFQPQQAPPARQPQTITDPNNMGAQQSRAGVTPAAVGNPAVLQQISATLEKTNKWLEEVHAQQLGNTRLLSVLLGMQLQLFEQQGLDADQLAKLMKASGPNAVADFLAHFQEQGKQGKGK